MTTKSKKNNPEQKSNFAQNLQWEAGGEFDPVLQLKGQNAKKSQAVKSKNKD